MQLNKDFKFAANLSLLFSEFPILERAKVAREYGFENAEFWWPFESATPSEREIEVFIESISSSGINLVALNFAAGNISNGDRGLIADPALKEEFCESVSILSHIADATGVRMFNLLAGNKNRALGAEIQEKTAAENIEFAIEKIAQPLGAKILIEQCNALDNPNYRLPLPEDAARIVEKFPQDLGIVFDTYHCAKAGFIPAEIYSRYSANIAHIQLADSPGRGEPGTGAIDFQPLFTEIKKSGYKGYISLEYKPVGDTKVGLNSLTI